MSTNSKKQVLSLDGKMKADTSAQKGRDKTTKLLTKSLEEGYFITAPIAGARFEGTVPVAVVMLPGYEIIIPFTQCVDLTGIKRPNDTRTDMEIAKFALDCRINSEIDFIVANINEKDGLAIASRTQAMKVKADDFYSRKSGKDFLMAPGLQAQARVVAVLPKLVIVELQGIETKVPIEDLIYHRAEDATSLFRNGQVVEVLIKEVRREEGKTPEIKVSVKETKPHPFENHQLQVGGKYSGRVTQINNQSAKQQIFVLLNDGNQVLCAPTERTILSIGQPVVVELTLINEEQQRIFGKVRE